MELDFKTKILIRMWTIEDKEELIALFPEIKDDNVDYCLIYQTIGQHGVADYEYIMQNSRNATEEEYKYLLNELIDIGYEVELVKG
jgi:hypothetical protein